MPVVPTPSIATFATAAIRDAVLPKPSLGQDCLLLDSGNVLYYYGPKVGWTPAWNAPWGALVDAGITNNVNVSAPGSGTGAHPFNYPPIAGLTSTFTPVYNRRYEFVFDGSFTSGADTDIVQLGIVLTNLRSGVQSDASSTWPAGSAILTAPFPARLKWRLGDAAVDGAFVLPLESVPHQINMIAVQISGSGGAVVGNAQYASALAAYDIGPIGPPF